MGRYGFGSCGSDACEADSTPESTFFLPAERATAVELERQAALFAGTASTAALLELMPVGVVILNQQRQIVFANDAFRTLCGREEKLVGLRLGEALACEHGEELPAGCGTTEFCTLCGAARSMQLAGRGYPDIRECRIVRNPDARGATALDLRVHSRAMTFAATEGPFLFMVLENIGDEKRRHLLERHFFTNVGAGLEEIQGLTGLLQIVGNVAPDQGAVLMKAIETTAGRLLEDLGAQEQLLAAERGTLEVMLETHETKPFLRRLLEGVAEERVATGRELRLDPAAVDLTLVTDGLLLEKVLAEMIRNALEAEAPGATVTVGCEPAGEDVRFWVHNPTPMPRAVQLQLFQRSFSTRAPDRGTGAYMMKLLSERYLDGVVTFISTPKDGTIFAALYPRRLETPAGS